MSIWDRIRNECKRDDERPPRKGWAPGQYIGSICRDCGRPFMGAKRAFQCADCAYIDWKPTHRHGKTGGLYRLLDLRPIIEKTMEEAVVYEDQSGRMWVRPGSEFFDGRFATVD